MGQQEEGVDFPTTLDMELAGIVQCWYSGFEWQELVESTSLDQGDLSRLLRRTIDLLRQIPVLPRGVVGEALKNRAREAADRMDRFPVSDDLPWGKINKGKEQEKEGEGREEEAEEEEDPNALFRFEEKEEEGEGREGREGINKDKKETKEEEIEREQRQKQQQQLQQLKQQQRQQQEQEEEEEERYIDDLIDGNSKIFDSLINLPPTEEEQEEEQEEGEQ